MNAEQRIISESMRLITKYSLIELVFSYYTYQHSPINSFLCVFQSLSQLFREVEQPTSDEIIKLQHIFYGAVSAFDFMETSEPKNKEEAAITINGLEVVAR